jgi:8-oxo-dGTP diphosphatase
MPSTAPEAVPVAVGILEDAQHRILVTRRPPGKHQGGKWEFPGGKIHPGEGMPAALARELHEELGIVVQDAQPLRRVHHVYIEKSVLLDVWRVARYTGEPHGREGQPLRWVTREELGRLDLPAADRPILRALGLPPLYLISDVRRFGEAVFLARLERVLEAGASLLQLREPDLPNDEYRALATGVTRLAHRHGARVLLNTDPELVAACGADGVHLNRHRLMRLTQRPLPPEYLVAASCHNAAELTQAAHVDADFAVLSPVLPTASHPGAVTLGWDGFACLRHDADIPVYALGGMQPGYVADAMRAGAHGLAMLSAVWASESPEAVVRGLLG